MRKAGLWFLFSAVLLGGIGAAQSAVCPTPGGTLTSIYEIQGSGEKSPLAGRTVTTRGIVTGDFQKGGYKGFFIQDATSDGDPTTSDGVFVYDSSDVVSPGDLVQLSAKVSEFKGLTELDSVSNLTVCGGGQSITPTSITLPVTSEGDLEAYEGMLVTFSQTLTVSETYNLGRYGELLLSSGGRLFNPNNDGDPKTFGTDPKLARRSLLLDDGSSRQDVNPVPYLDSDHTRRDGDTVANLTGVLNEAFGSYLLEPTVPPDFVDANPRPTQPEEVGGSLKVVAFNVDNYFTTLDNGSNGARGADSEAEFQRQQAKLVAALKALDADVVGLAELQNNGMKAEDTLVRALNKAYGSDVYAAVPDPVQGTGTDAIKVGILYKPAKVKPLGPSISDPESIYNRYPVAQAFTQEGGAGGSFTFVINHLKSKGGCPDSGDVDRGQGCWNKRRTAQARALLGFVAELQKRVQDPDVLLMGDFNSYLEEDPITTLTRGGLTNFSASLPQASRYSYVFDGQAGLLDYMLTTPSLAAQVTGETVFHINSDEPRVLDYNTEYNPAYLYQPTMYRASDHDPDMVGLELHADTARTP